MVVVLATLVVPTVTAQKINDAAFKARLEKSDAEIANPKKSGKATTWINRAKICSDAITAPTKGLFAGLDEGMLAVSIGTQPSEVKDGVYEFERIKVHTKGGKVLAWSIKSEVLPNASQIATEALKKAYELDNKLGSKIMANTMFLSNALAQQGEALNNVGLTKEAAEAFELAFRAQQIIPETALNAGLIYNAGVLNTQLASTLSGEESIALYAKAQAEFNEAVRQFNFQNKLGEFAPVASAGGGGYYDGGGSNPTPKPQEQPKTEPVEENTGDAGFTGNTYSEAVAYMKSQGVSGASAAGIKTQSEFKRSSSSREFNSYTEYLQYTVDKKISTK